MAQTPPAEATVGFWALTQTEQPPPGAGDVPPAGFGNPTTLLLLLLAAGFLWWNMRRRRAFEERLRQQRREEAIAHAEQSAQNVAHIMRQRATPEAVAAAASEGLASAARVPVPPPDAGADGTGDVAEDAGVLDRAEAVARADRAAAEQVEDAARRAGGVARRDAAAAAAEGEQVARQDAAVVAEARANQAGALRTGVVPGATGALEEVLDPTEALRAGLRELESEVEAPIGAIAGDGSPICPPEYPVKGTLATKIYHLPGQRSYPPVVADVCFASAEAAEAAGFARASEENAPA